MRRGGAERDVKMAARATQLLCYHIAWVVIKTQNRHGNESGTITIKAERQRGGQPCLLLKAATQSSSLSSSFMHIQIQYGCPKETLDCVFHLRFCCNVHKEPDFKLTQAILLNILLHTNTGAFGGIILVKLNGWNVTLMRLT